MSRSNRKERTPCSLHEFKKFYGIKPPSRRAYPKQVPDVTKHFYPRKPLRPRLDITIDEIKDILFISTAEAHAIVTEIKTKPYRSEFPFVTVKEFARYAKLKIWQVHHYFISYEMYKYSAVREEYKGRQH